MEKIKSMLQILVLSFVFGFPFTPVAAQQLDVEIDPIAYGLDGFSVHTAYGVNGWRFDLGVYGLTLPEAIHGNEGLSAKFVGAGWKVDRFLKGGSEGAFVGIDGGVSRKEIGDVDTRETAHRVEYAMGGRIGYRWMTGLGNLYVTPWVGLGYVLNAEDVVLNGKVFENSAFQPFPTIHVGWRF